jgi:hypothetical protein
MNRPVKSPVRFYRLCANCVSQVETVGGPHRLMPCYLSYKLSNFPENLSEWRSTKEILGLLYRRHEIIIRTVNDRFANCKIPPKKTVLGTYCFFRLLMLHYNHSRLKRPLPACGIETFNVICHTGFPGWLKRPLPACGIETQLFIRHERLLFLAKEAASRLWD